MLAWRQIMLKQTPVLICLAFLSCAALLPGQSLRSTMKGPAAGVRGRITIDDFVRGKVQTNPIPKLKLYLLRVDDSKPLVELQEGCSRAVSDPGADPLRAYNLCAQNLRRAVALVPTLPSVATAETNRDGEYEFDTVPAAGRYHVVGVKTVEGAEPIVMVGVTNKLRAGDHVTLNLSANDPWTRAVTP
jgi:hypothetical protein